MGTKLSIVLQWHETLAHKPPCRGNRFPEDVLASEVSCTTKDARFLNMVNMVIILHKNYWDLIISNQRHFPSLMLAVLEIMLRVFSVIM